MPGSAPARPARRRDVAGACALAFLAAASAFGQPAPAWNQSVPLPSQPGPLADFNGDGKLDLIIRPAGVPAAPLRLLLGNGDGSFRAGPAPMAAPGGPSAAGDLNGDGKPDLVVCLPGAGSTGGAYSGLAILLNAGDGTFRQAGVLAAAACNGSLILADLNGDGHADIYDSGTYIWFGNGDGTFGGPVSYPASLPFYSSSGLPAAPVIADFNGDGLPDLAAVSSSGTTHQAAVWWNQGGGVFPAKPVTAFSFSTSAGSTNPDSLAAGDFNGDGEADLAVLTPIGELRVFLGARDGAFQPGAAYSIPFVPAAGLYARGMSPDGRLDLVVTSDRISILRGRGDGTFGARTDACAGGVLGVPFDVFGNTGALEFGDFNGDGIADIIDFPDPNAFGNPAAASMLLLSGASAPPLIQGGPLNAATFLAGPISAGEVVTVFGAGLGGPGCQGRDEEVTFNGIPGGILYASSTQIDVQVPWELAGATGAQVAALRNGMPGALVPAVVQAASPGIFTLSENGAGAGAIVPAGTHKPSSPDNPAVRGQYASIYATGLGSVTNTPVTGRPSPQQPLAQTTAMPEVIVGGVKAQVSWSGLSPGFTGLYQVNFKVPSDAPVGDAVPVTVSIDGVASAAATMAVR